LPSKRWIVRLEFLTDGTLELRNRWFADSLLERTGFELVVPDLSETFLYPSGAVNWPGSHSRF
jgi:hypothetical protein